jgi:hypothetical protein
MTRKMPIVLTIGITIGLTLLAFAFMGVLDWRTDQTLPTISQGPEQFGDISSEQSDLDDVEPYYAATAQYSLGHAENGTPKKTICVYDEYSKKGIKSVGIYVDKIHGGTTTGFGCTDVVIPNDGSEHTISIKGRSLLASFKDTQTIDFTIVGRRIEFYVDLYNDRDLYEIAYKLVNKYRIKQNLPIFNRGNDLNAQEWAEHLHRNMMTDNGMMENARIQIAHTYGYINERNVPDCIKSLKSSDCPQTYYTYSCESADCTIERGDTVKKIITEMLDNKSFRSKEFHYVTIGISYDPHVMFVVVNLK